MTDEAKLRVLEAFDRSLAREVHNIARWPTLIRQQLENRLQWEVAARPRLQPDGRSDRPSGKPQLRVRTQFHESSALIQTLPHGFGSVLCCAVSADGAYILSGDHQRDTLMWQAQTGSLLGTFTSHADIVHGCAISADGTWIVSAGADRTLKIWDPLSGSLLRTLLGHTDHVLGCAVAPISDRIVSGSADRTLKIWDRSTGSERATLTGHTDAVHGCAISPDGRWIVSASADGTLKIWDPSGSVLATLTGHTDAVHGCAISPDGTWIVSASADRTLKIWTRDRLVREPEIDPVPTPHASRYSGWLGRLEREAEAEAIRGRDMAISTLEGHALAVRACAVTPDGERIVSASVDRTVKIWDANKGVSG